MFSSGLKLGAAGMRGEIGLGLKPQALMDFACAYATYNSGGTILLGRDTRTSSEMIFHAVSSALNACGCQVFNCGIIPAPLLQFMVQYSGADGGMLIGAGHQKSPWNALIALDSDGSYLNEILLRDLFNLYHSKRYSFRRWNNCGKINTLTLPESCDAYIRLLDSLLDREKIAARNFKVIADFCNGSGSVIFKQIADFFNLEVIELNNIISGVLPHDPEPRPRSGAQISSIIKPLKADAGFVFNSDMSRCSVVCENAETLSEEYTLTLAIDNFLHTRLKKNEENLIFVNCCSTRRIDDLVAATPGARIEKTKVGQAAIIDAMKQFDGAIGGEGSGSVALRGGINGFDGCLGTLMVLEHMAVSDCSLSEICNEIPRYFTVKRSIRCSSPRAYRLLNELKESFRDARIDETDGLRFDWEYGWLNVRASATEPMIRMICEWQQEDEAHEKAMQIISLLEKMSME